MKFSQFCKILSFRTDERTDENLPGGSSGSRGRVPARAEKKKPSTRELQAAATKRMTIDLQIDRLNGLANDPPLPFPHTSQIDGPLRELRCHYGRAHYRILYRRSGNLFVLLHMIRKTSRAVPQAEIEIAKQRWQDFKERMEARPRKPPRAAGGDAP